MESCINLLQLNASLHYVGHDRCQSFGNLESGQGYSLTQDVNILGEKGHLKSHLGRTVMNLHKTEPIFLNLHPLST